MQVLCKRAEFSASGNKENVAHDATLLGPGIRCVGVYSRQRRRESALDDQA